MPALTRALSRDWWVLLWRGLFAITFGAMALAWPGLTLATLVLLYGVFTLADGLIGIWASWKSRRSNDRWWALLLWAAFSAAAGALAIARPDIAALALVLVVAAWAMATGVAQILMAMRLRHEIEGEWLLGTCGAVSLLAGLALAAWPGAGALSLVWLIGSLAIAQGVLLTLLSLRLRRLFHH
jgi:uncharacterized membrane protein HdeD (DUF308 family)